MWIGALRLCVALFRFWDMREHSSEGRARLETVRTMAGWIATKERARISHFLGALAARKVTTRLPSVFLNRASRLYEDLDDEPGIAASLNALAISARDAGDYVSAHKQF